MAEQADSNVFTNENELLALYVRCYFMEHL